jgi:hypothetical protein
MIILKEPGTVTADSITREDVLRTLQADNVLLQIWAICPHGSMGPMMRRFFLNDLPHSPLQFTSAHPEATNMSRLSSLHPGLTGILPLADAMWERARQPHEKFYGHSYTCTAPTLHFLPPAIRTCLHQGICHSPPTQTQQCHTSPSLTPGPNRTPLV